MNMLNTTETEALESTELAALPAEVVIKPEKLPYHERELKTLSKLTALKMEAMLRDFERETGASIWTLRRDYDGNISIDVQHEGKVVYAHY
jgi:hypothetical protein